MTYTKRELCFNNAGRRIYGEIYLPRDGERFPAVILSHGYNSSHSDLADLAEKLAGSGIAAYVYDFCGGSSRSKSEGSTTEMSAMTECADLRTVIDGISASDFFDGGKLFLYGESQGGFVSAITAAGIPDRIAALALLYPAFCIPDDWKGKLAPDCTDIFDFMGMKISARFALDLPEYDVFEHMKAYTSPTVIFHGDADAVVNISYSERLVEAMDDCELLVYENEGHGFFPDARADMTGKAAEFFLRQLKK